MKTKTQRNLKILALRRKGKSYNTIAKLYNLTPQRIHAIDKRFGAVDNSTIDNNKDKSIIKVKK